MLKKMNYVTRLLGAHADSAIGLRMEAYTGETTILVAAPCKARWDIEQVFGASSAPTLSALDVVRGLTGVPVNLKEGDFPATAWILPVAGIHESQIMTTTVGDDTSEVSVNADGDTFYLVVSGKMTARVPETARHMSVAATVSLAEVLAAKLDVPAEELREFTELLAYGATCASARVTLIDELCD